MANVGLLFNQKASFEALINIFEPVDPQAFCGTLLHEKKIEIFFATKFLGTNNAIIFIVNNFWQYYLCYNMRVCPT